MKNFSYVSIVTGEVAEDLTLSQAVKLYLIDKLTVWYIKINDAFQKEKYANLPQHEEGGLDPVDDDEEGGLTVR